MEAAGLNLRFEREADAFVGWRGTVTVEGIDHFLRIVYPMDFPARPPWVRETAPFKDEVVDDKVTFHQLIDGSLCLFALGDGDDAWSTELTVVDVVARYREFRSVANERGHVDEHGRPLGDFAGLPAFRPLILTPAQSVVLRAPGGRGWVYAHPLLTGAALIAGRVAGQDETIHADQAAGPWRAVKEHLRFPWVRVNVERWRTSFPDPASVDAVLPESARASLGPEGLVLLVRELPDGQVECLLTWRSQPAEPSASVLVSSSIEVVDLSDSLFARVDGAMSGRETLGDWNVVLVGLGSLGSSVAAHLARSGVSRFTLYDPDVLRAENVVRHALGLGGIYCPKPLAVKAAILDRNPWATVDTHASSPLWDGIPKASAAFEALLAQAKTLVVVTTADDQVERAINDLAVQHRAPVIYASVLGAAEHGRIFRVIPLESACYQCVLDGYRAEPERFFRLNEDIGTTQPALAGYRQPGIPGLGIDVELVALNASRFVLQTLSRLNNGSPEYADAPGHHLVWSNAGGRGFDGPLQARWEPYERRPGCPVCGDPDRVGAWGEAEAAELRALERTLRDPSRMAPSVPVVGSAPKSKPEILRE